MEESKVLYSECCVKVLSKQQHMLVDSLNSPRSRPQEGLELLEFWDAWVAQLVEPPTLGFSSGHDFMVCGFEPQVRL